MTARPRHVCGYTANMKVLLSVCFAAALLGASKTIPASPEFLAVKAVYLLPMRSGFDQYLANELTRGGVLRVVADPAHADAVITDRLGEPFEQKLDDLESRSKPPAPLKSVPEVDADGKKKTLSIADAMSEASRDSHPPVSSLSLGRGNVFLVAMHSRDVLWSDFRQPRGYTPKDLKRAAGAIAVDLSRALQPSPPDGK